MELNTKVFDLNIEEMLDNWEVEHALREVIANALDEQLLSGSADIQIEKVEPGQWRIRDHGRGLRIEHFTQNEDDEKRATELPVIGKFGVGLKDALATLHRRGVGVQIRSRYGKYSLSETAKHGFEEIVTLHVEYDDMPLEMTGSEFLLDGVTNEQIEQARSLFLRFSDDKVIESTHLGEIIERREKAGRVYIRGVLASEEENFLFSYNITDLTPAMQKRLNRERLNVGRSTYTERIKAMLKSAKSEVVKERLIDQVNRRRSGDQRDELSWIDINQHAMNLMAESRQVTYVTEQELQAMPDLIGHARRGGQEVIIISERQKEKTQAQAAAGGPQLRTLELFAQEFNETFQYQFVEPAALSAREASIFGHTQALFSLGGISTIKVEDVRISETIQITSSNTQGVWDHRLGAIVIKRSVLGNLAEYAGTLLHEAIHATTDLPDVSRAFETELTNMIGRLAVAMIELQEQRNE